MPKKPKQIEPLLDPNEPETAHRFPYYLLEKHHSPPVAPPNALRWKNYEYARRLREDDPNDERMVYGFIEYEKSVDWADLRKYNMLPFGHDEGIFFDMWRGLGDDKDALLAYLELFFQMVDGDQGLRRLRQAINLYGRNWTIGKARQTIRELGH